METTRTEHPVLQVSGLNIVARLPNGDRPILHDISFELISGEILAVIGESGSGKTVLARALASWLSAPLTVTQGEVRFRGTDLLKDTAMAKRLAGREIAYIGGNPAGALDPTMTVGAQLVEKLRAVRPDFSAAAARDKAIELLEAVRIPAAPQRFNEYPFQYSGGMMQRAMIVDALISDPALLIADNITQPLDVTVAAQILKLMRELNAEFQTAVLFISHDLAMVRRVCSRICVMYLGEAVEVAPNERLFFDPGHPYSRALLSAAPTLEERRYRPEDCLLEGEPPSPIDLPPGCAFASRCPNVFDRCRSENPTLTSRGDHALSACFLNTQSTLTAAE
ncbi:UNVERIFIED_CONTAM: hypothetical protein GTU68_017863 [Idotea baltica]|nr:hypothetical protein [Idotea baltica]